jgi:hypothetical protein
VDLHVDASQHLSVREAFAGAYDLQEWAGHGDASGAAPG